MTTAVLPPTPCPATRRRRQQQLRLLGGNGPRPASAPSSTVRPCQRVVRPGPALCRLSAQSRPSSTRPRTGGRRTAPCDREGPRGSDSYRGVHTGPVSHADRIHPPGPVITSFLAIPARNPLSPCAQPLHGLDLGDAHSPPVDQTGRLAQGPPPQRIISTQCSISTWVR